MRKKCRKCGKIKEHGQDRSSKSGVALWCKPCTAEYRHQPKYRWAKAWNNLNLRAGNKIGNRPTYKDVKVLITKEEFKEWYIETMEDWEASHPRPANYRDYPSIDRIDNDGHYEPTNLQVISIGDNSRKRPKNYNQYAPIGKSWCTVCKAFRDITEFQKNRTSATGYEWLCKTHKNEKNRKYRSKK